MNPRSQWFKLDSQFGLIQIIRIPDSLGLKNWSGFIRIQSLGSTRTESDRFSTDLHETRLKTFLFARISSNTDSAINRNKSDWFRMNFNRKIWPRLYYNSLFLGSKYFLMKYYFYATTVSSSTQVKLFNFSWVTPCGRLMHLACIIQLSLLHSQTWRLSYGLVMRTFPAQ